MTSLFGRPLRQFVRRDAPLTFASEKVDPPQLADGAPQSIVAAHAALSLGPVEVTAQIFTRISGGWCVRICGDELPLPEMDGINYYEHLLGRPNRGISLSELAGVVVSAADVEYFGERKHGVVLAKQPVVTRDDLAQYWRQHNFLRELVRQAKSLFDRKRLESERTSLAAHIRSVSGRNGEPRLFISEADKLRTRQWRAMKRVREKLEKCGRAPFVALECFLHETVSMENGLWWYQPNVMLNQTTDRTEARVARR
jgi:hypothetical protein